MKHLIFAYSVISYSSGVLSLMVLILAYLKVRLKTLLYLWCFLLMETIQLLYFGYYQYLYINNIPVLFHDYHFVVIYSMISFTIIVLPLTANELCGVTLRRPINYLFVVLFLIGLACIVTPYFKGYISAGVPLHFLIRFKIYLIFTVGAALYAFLVLILKIKNVSDTKDRILFLSLALFIIIIAFQLVVPVFKTFPEIVLIFATSYLFLNVLILKYLFGKFFLPSKSTQQDLLREVIELKITDRERDILNLMVQGLTSKDIGAKLFITEATVKTHIRNIYKKLSIQNRIQLFNLLKGRTESE